MGRLRDLWARLKGKRKATPALSPANVWRSRVAVHEAGHAVVAWCCTAVRDVVVDVCGEHAGMVTYELRTTGRRDLWSAMVIDLGGIAAENHVFRSFRTGESRDDLMKALNRARGFVRSGGQRAQSGEQGVVPFAKLFVPPIGEPEALALGAAYEEAKRLVVGHGERYFRLVSLIMACPKLSERQMGQVLGSRLPMVLLHSLGVNRFMSPRGG